MKSSRITIIAGLAAVSLLTLSVPVGASGDEIEGMILSRGGDALTVSGFKRENNGSPERQHESQGRQGSVWPGQAGNGCHDPDPGA
jgi:hypothetical protein